MRFFWVDFADLQKKRLYAFSGLAGRSSEFSSLGLLLCELADGVEDMNELAQQSRILLGPWAKTGSACNIGMREVSR